jgi:ferrous iron transport protein B
VDRALPGAGRRRLSEGDDQARVGAHARAAVLDAGTGAAAAAPQAPELRTPRGGTAPPCNVGPASAVDRGRAPRPRTRRIALVGNPNVGKSVVFGALTGTYATVSNYPGTTVDVAQAATRADPSLQMVDTPGVNGLIPNSEDEQVTRDILLAGVDAVVQVADAKNLARALAVSLQLAEAGLPFVLVLNMMDEAADRGVRVDVAALAARLGVPVVPTVAVTGHGLATLARSLAAATTSHVRAAYPQAAEDEIGRLEPLLAGYAIGPRALALMCLAGDETLRPWLAARLPAAALAAVEDAHRRVQAAMHGRARYRLGRVRVRAAEDLARGVLHVAPVAPAAPPRRARRRAAGIGVLALTGCLGLLAGDAGVLPFAAAPVGRVAGWLAIATAVVALDRSAEMRAALGRWAARRGAGLAVLLVVLYVVYRFVGTFAAGTGVDFLEHTVFGGWVNPHAVAAVDGAIAALAPVGPAAALAGFVRGLLVGPYGLVTVALTYAFAIILPIVTAFFLAFSVLEDSGYLPRLAVVTNNVFRGMGLNGKAVLPMVLGLGCDTMATVTARIMETRKERVLVTLLLALGVPCSAQLGVTLGLLGGLPLWAPLVWGGVVAGVLFAVGFLAARLLPGERSDLILEMPPIRRPQLRNVVVKTLGRLEWYLREAVPIFVLGTLVLFLLDALGTLAHLVRACEPAVVGLLGLPPRATEAFLVGFFRRDYGAAGIYALSAQGLLTPVQTVVALVTITLFVPCVANLFMIVKERGAATGLAITGFVFPLAFVVGGAVNVALRAAGLR